MLLQLLNNFFLVFFSICIWAFRWLLNFDTFVWCCGDLLWCGNDSTNRLPLPEKESHYWSIRNCMLSWLLCRKRSAWKIVPWKNAFIDNYLRLVSSGVNNVFRVRDQSELPRPILSNQTSDVHGGPTLITRVITWRWRYTTWRWRHRKHVDTITSVIAAKQMVKNEVCFISIKYRFIEKYINFIYSAE